MKIWEIIDTVKLSDEKMGICTGFSKCNYRIS